jgi:cell division initiation protein
MYDDQPTHQTLPAVGETAEFLASRGPTSILEELRDAEFPVALRGYDREAVNAYIDRVAELVEDLAATRSPQVAVNRALQDLGEETAGVLRQAQDTARQMTERSQAEARERLEEADREARRRREEAAAHVRRLDEDADRIWEERQRLIANTRSLAESLLKLADDAEERFPAERPQPTDGLSDSEEVAGDAVEEGAKAVVTLVDRPFPG